MSRVRIAPGRAADSDPWPRRASAAVRHLESQGAHLEVAVDSSGPVSADRIVGPTDATYITLYSVPVSGGRKERGRAL